jgi:hypothetical protein
MKINELLNESFHDDWDSEEDEVVIDPDQDKVPHLIMQFKKSIDNGGRSPILFKDGSKANVPHGVIAAFMNKYHDMKPADREAFQAAAIKSIDAFKQAMTDFRGEKAPKSIYV